MNPHPASAILRYRINGQRHTRRISAMRYRDTEETLRAHLARWCPQAEWLGYSWADKRKK